MQKSKEIIPTEEQEQEALADLLDRIKYQGRSLRWCHVPNGGKRHIGTAVKMKKAGVKAGMPDILIFDAPPAVKWAFKGAVIELKKIKNSHVSENQAEWLNYFLMTGWAAKVCYGIDGAIQQLKDWGYLKE